MPTYKIKYFRSFLGECEIDAKDENEARVFFESYDPDDPDFFECGEDTRIESVTQVDDE